VPFSHPRDLKPSAVLAHARRERGVRTVLYERGAQMLAALLADGALDELLLTIAPQIEPDPQQPPITELPASRSWPPTACGRPQPARRSCDCIPSRVRPCAERTALTPRSGDWRAVGPTLPEPDKRSSDGFGRRHGRREHSPPSRECTYPGEARRRFARPGQGNPSA
jgi:hypothetical protein